MTPPTSHPPLPPLSCLSPPLVSQRHGNLPAHLLQHQHVPGNEHGQQHRQPAAQSQGVQLEPGAHGQLSGGGGGGGGGSHRRGGGGEEEDVIRMFLLLV